MTYVWKDEDYQRLPQHVQDARALLQEWFAAMEDGSSDRRLPDPQHPSGITPEQADALVKALDDGFERELRLWANKDGVDGGPFVAGPEFHRLAMSQRLALAQQLWDIVRSAREDDLCSE